MKKAAFHAIVFAVALSGCAANLLHVDNGNPYNPVVTVVDDLAIKVEPDPLRFLKHEQNVRITWQIPSESRYTFTEDGIVIRETSGATISARTEFKCGRDQDPRKFSCLNKHTGPGKYKYIIKVEGPHQIMPLDPIIDNY